ncbi:MAG: hypothetical protein EAZ66_06980, partial [Alphaproteobacteria bacterium]
MVKKCTQASIFRFLHYQFNHFSSGTKWSHDVGYDTKDLNFAEQMLRAHNYQFGVLKEINSPVVERAFNAWIKYINLNANLVSPTSLPWLKDITIVESSTLLDQENKAVGGVTIAPNQQLNQRIVVVINANLGGGYNDGDKKYSTLIHEIGHALGLFTSGSVTHPHQHNSAYRQDTTVMSYIDGAYIGNGIGQKYASTPMMYDIAALQHLYGAKGDTTSGNNRYEITDTKKGWTIWDSGGKDTLDASALPASRSVLIDLRGGTDENNNVYFSQTVNGFLKPEEGKYYGKPYGSKEVVAIAYQDANTSQDKVRIEDGWGGAGHDVLIGGKGANELKGNGGNDTLIGGNGIDTLDGGAGIDFLYGDQDDVLKGGEHTDLIASYQGVEQEDGSVLLGSTSWAQLYGGTGEDALTGDGATDHFGIFGLGIVKGGAEKIDRVYVNNRQATGGETPFIYDMPAAWNPWQGHLLALFNGSPQEENGATLGVK